MINLRPRGYEVEPATRLVLKKQSYTLNSHQQRATDTSLNILITKLKKGTDRSFKCSSKKGKSFLQEQLSHFRFEVYTEQDPV